MSERIEQLKAASAKVADFDLTHDELGTANGFHEAQEAKEALHEDVEFLLKDLDAYGSAVNQHTLDTGLTQIENALKQIKSHKANIDKLVEEGVHQQNFPPQRESHVTGLQNQKNSFDKATAALQTELRLAKMESREQVSDAAEKAGAEIQRLVAETSSSAAEARKILENLNERVAERAVSDASEDFNRLRDHHKEHEASWFKGLVGATLLTIIAALIAILWPFQVDDVADVIWTVFRRALLVSLALILLRICLSKYNIERNLRILYSHRQTVLDQYRTFEGAIGDDAEAKNQFRLEIAKVIFSDPNTGYVESDRGNELNIHPAVSTIQRSLRD